jgi:hypothetical protein
MDIIIFVNCVSAIENLLDVQHRGGMKQTTAPGPCACILPIIEIF